MKEIISKNPFRILGVFSNSPEREFVSNTSRLKAYASLGKVASLPSDIKISEDLPPRSSEDLEWAASAIYQPKEKLKYACFWFLKGNSYDEIAFQNINNHDIEKAISILEKSESFSSKINLGILALLEDDLDEAVNQITSVIHDEADMRIDFVKNVCGDNFQIEEDELAKLFIDQLLEIYPIDEVASSFESYGSSYEDDDYIKEKSSKKYIEVINDAVNKAKAADASDYDAQYESGISLINSTKDVVEALQDIFDEDDEQFKMVIDNLARQILQCGINYYNNSPEDDEYKELEKAYYLQNFALQLAKGNVLRTRCKENVAILQKKKDSMPPAEVKSFHQILSNHMDWFNGQPQSFPIVLKFLERTVPALVSIKSVLGKSNKYYNEISSVIANLALQDSIAALNEQQETNLPMLKNEFLRSGAISALKSAFHDSWKIMIWLELMDTTAEFRTKRLQPNKETLKGILDQVEAFSPSTIFGGTVFSGCASNISIDREMYMTEDEIFAKCSGRAGYQAYIRKYPQGKYVAKARKWIADDDARIAARKKAAQDALISDLSSCTSIQRCIDFYKKHRNSASDMTPLTNKFFSLCSSQEDYQKLVSTISNSDPNYKKAKEKIDYYKSFDEFSFERDWWIILIIHSIWGLFGADDGIGGFFGAFAAGIAGWIIPINYVGYYIIAWIRKQMILNN